MAGKFEFLESITERNTSLQQKSSLGLNSFLVVVWMKNVPFHLNIWSPVGSIISEGFVEPWGCGAYLEEVVAGAGLEGLICSDSGLESASLSTVWETTATNFYHCAQSQSSSHAFPTRCTPLKAVSSDRLLLLQVVFCQVFCHSCMSN